MKSSLMWFSKITEFICQGSKVTPNTLKNLIAESDMLENFLHTKISCLTFSTWFCED